MKQSPYVRAVWHLRPFSFDPATKEQLLAACPVCTKPLGFSVTKGVAFCDHCVAPGRFGELWPSVDLRDFPQPLVEVEDIEALDFVTGLVDPDPAVRQAFRPSLHDDLADASRGDLWEMALAIANNLQLDADPDYTASILTSHRSKIRAFEPHFLALAGRALLSWPKGFSGLLEAATDDAARRDAQWGKTKEFGALGNLVRDEFLSPSIRQLLGNQIDRYFMEAPIGASRGRKRGARNPDIYVGARELHEVTGNSKLVARLARHPKVVTFRSGPPPAPLIFLRMQVDPILRLYGDLAPEHAIAFDLGVPVETLRDMEAAGYLARASGVETALVRSPVNYSRSQIDALFGFYQGIVPVIPDADDFVGFKDVMLMFPAGRKPWFALWEQILQGGIHSHLKRPRTKALTDVVEVRRSSINLVALARRMADLPAPDIDVVTLGNVQLMLGIPSYYVLAPMIEADLLTPSPVDKTVKYAQVMEFAAQYIQPPEISARTGVPRGMLIDWLSERGVEPARHLGVKGGQIYDRVEVEPLLPK